MKFTTGLTAYRDAMAVEDAIKHRNAANLAGQGAAALVFALGLLKGSRYAHYVEWLTPEVALQLMSVLAAGVSALFGWGHFAGNGVVAAAVASAPVAGNVGLGTPLGDAPPAATVGSVTADTGNPGEVRPGPDPSNPTGDYLRG